MTSNTLRFFTLVLSLSGTAAIGCKSDDGDDKGGAGTGVTAGTGGGAGTGGTAQGFKATLMDPQTMVAVAGHEVLALNNSTGADLGKKVTSGTDGALSFEGLPAGMVAFVAKGMTGKTIDTYQFNIDASAQDEKLWVVAKSTAMFVPQIAEFTPNLEKAAISGGVYWVNAQGVEETVGCATVAFAGTGDASDIRYFGDSNLPAPVAMRMNTNPLNGRYFVGNAPTGTQSVTASVDGKMLGSTTLMLFARKVASDGEESVCISNIYVTAAANPTPAGCK
jgi:hypothetical protein